MLTFLDDLGAKSSAFYLNHSIFSMDCLKKALTVSDTAFCRIREWLEKLCTENEAHLSTLTENHQVKITVYVPVLQINSIDQFVPQVDYVLELSAGFVKAFQISVN
jgi:hypothetical protein